MGEHSAVYGGPAVVTTVGMTCRTSADRPNSGAVRLTLDDEATLVDASWDRLREYAAQAGDDQVRPTVFDLAEPEHAHRIHLPLIALGEFAAAHPPCSLPPLNLRITSTVPPSRGMGSSAALAVSVLAALGSVCGTSGGIEALEPLIAAVEQRQHHAASGIDHRTIMLGRTVAFRRRGDRSHGVPVPDKTEVLTRLAIYDTGPTEATGQVVAGVRQHLLHDERRLRQVLDAMAKRTDTFIRALDGDGDARAVTESITSYQRGLEALGVVPDPIRILVRRIEAAGGAAKISGSGSLTGPGAGALIVYWPLGPPSVPLNALAPYPRIVAPLGVDGLKVTTCP
ncbi:mevalonate kinase family protein [Phytomonospora endophytica]|uniref:mevalonate kinase n=1 Tax=Phytomonospora endophytica TaxID=714109 RepID=A0A841FR51_9ACTN|nr:hypothetical protein [Phytomonospora endophytica]MBB6038675.1 mevalonate kinase [Phytomonospora endophytica]GIG69180.1 hypothetical protein Pen01_54750 [Phytomonospora endophytica]